MKTILRRLEELEDPRQPWKVKHKLGDIIGIVLFATLGNANDWQEIAAFAQSHEDTLRKYFKLENGIPSHDTIQRVMGILSPKILQQLQVYWQEALNTNEGQKLIKILNIDGKTMRGSKREGTQALHIVSAWSKEDGICLGQVSTKEKSNEITAIPELLKMLNISKHIVTIDAMGTQRAIAQQIIEQKGQYVLAVKGNQGNLYKDLAEYFQIEEELEKMKKAGKYKLTKEKSRSQIESREYYQTEEIGWLGDKEKWSKLRSIGMVRTRIEKRGEIREERRYYISSMGEGIEEFAKAVRGHWSIESMHWQLDVTFREDHNQTIDKRGNENLNIMRNWSLSILKLMDMGKGCSIKTKRYMICCNPAKYLADILML